jgi:hypothetical protein
MCWRKLLPSWFLCGGNLRAGFGLRDARQSSRLRAGAVLHCRHDGGSIVRARQRVRVAIFTNCLRQRSALPGGHDCGGRVSFGLCVFNAFIAN